MGSRKKKNLLLIVGPLSVRTLGKKGSKISTVFLNGPALYPPPLLLMARPLREELFFAASLCGNYNPLNISLCTIHNFSQGLDIDKFERL